MVTGINMWLRFGNKRSPVFFCKKNNIDLRSEMEKDQQPPMLKSDSIITSQSNNTSYSCILYQLSMVIRNIYVSQTQTKLA